MNRIISWEQWKNFKKVHILGIAGTMMGAFAIFLKRQGILVTGSDQSQLYPPMSERLAQAGITVYTGYLGDHFNQQSLAPDCVIVGNVIRASNPEMQAVIQRGYQYFSLPEVLEQLFLSRTYNLVVAGTHGKTTTSSLLVYVLQSFQKNLSYLIGGVSPQLPLSLDLDPGLGLMENTFNQDRSYFVLEGDEYDTAFWDKVPKFYHYQPHELILTSLEYDHADIYPDFQSLYQVFEGLIHRMIHQKRQGPLVVCYDTPVLRELTAGLNLEILSYGLKPSVGVRFSPKHICFESHRTCFEIWDGGHCVDEIQIALSGHHNILNALAVWIQTQSLALDRTRVASALASFQGVKRRQEFKAQINGIDIFDDFAHHPTAVRETLQAFRFKYPHRPIRVVFEPRSATSRRKVFQQQYVQAFQNANTTYIAKPYDQTSIEQSDQFSSHQLVHDLHQQGQVSHLIEDSLSGAVQVADEAQQGDVIIFLSNGSFNGFLDLLMSQLKKNTIKKLIKN